MKRVILRIIVCFMLMPVCAFAATRRDSDGAVASRTTGAVVMRGNATNSRGTSVTPSPASDREIKRSSISRVVPAEAESRAVANVRSRTAKNVTSRATTPVVSGRSTGQRAATVSRTAVTNNATANRTGITRGGVASRKNTTNSTRALKTRAATTQSEEKKDVASLIEDMTSKADLSNFCKTKYSECMDNFCNVLDEKQGRCSCSKNVKNYEKSENGLKQATAALQDVAQQIQYIGLTANEIDTLFAETEAEAAMSGTSDNSQLKNDLDKIKGLIVDVKPGTASSSDMSNDLSLDLSGLLDFNFSSSGFDLGTLFGTQSANTNSISNQRGEQLYKTAAARCRTDVLNECKKLGVDISVVINSYDMTIDRECIAYERTLNESNDEMLQTVRNAQSVLQRARLMVAQQKNSYDLRGCISALDSCMQDDFVCGSDYEKCLDPTGKYIVDGEIIVGSAPGRSGDVGNAGLYKTWEYNSSNAWGSGSIDDYLKEYLTATYPESNLTVMANYLHNKIGKITDDGRAQGMCVAVLNRCRDYTYTEGKNGKYIPNNRVIREWMERTFIKIKNAQDSLLANYAESCVSDVTSCLTENNYDKSDKTSTKSNVAINACSSRILTCMSVNADTSTSVSGTMKDWVAGIMGASSANQGNNAPGNSGQGSWGDIYGASNLIINFDVDGGTSVASATCKIGDTFTLPVAPSKDGYTFVGWYVKGVLTTETSLSCNADTLGATNGSATIKAAWKFDYSAYQNLCERDGNGTWNAGNNTCTCNEGYALGSDNTCVYKGDEEPATTITVKYNSDGGTSVADATYTVGGTFTLPVAPSKDGYTFDGWTIGTAKYDAGAELVLSDVLTSGQTEVTVTATWMPNTITILFEDPNNYLDNWSDVETSCTYGGTLDLSEYPIKGEGYVWNVNGVQYEYNQTIDCTKDILGVDSGEVSFIVDTRGEQVTITYDTGGGTSVASQTATYGSSIVLAAAPKRTGYTFAGWNVNGETYGAGTSVVVDSANAGVNQAAVQVSAQWEPETVEVVYINEQKVIEETSCTYGTQFTLRSGNDLTRTGYTFEGWHFNGDVQQPGEIVSCTVDALGQYFTLGYAGIYVQWRGNTINISYDLGGGTSGDDTAAMVCTAGDKFTLPAAPTRSNYNFRGWNVGGTIYGAGAQATCLDSGFTVTAEWVYQGTVYTITLDSLSADDPQTIYSNGVGTYYSDQEMKDEITQINIPQRNGYSFDGYHILDGNGTYNGPVLVGVDGVLATPSITDSVTAYARWNRVREVTKKDFELKFNLNGGYAADCTGTHPDVVSCTSGDRVWVPCKMQHDSYSKFVGYLVGYGLACPYIEHDAMANLDTLNINTLWSNGTDVSGAELEGSSSTYTLHFDTWGGAPVESVTCSYGETVTMPSAPEIDGYIFDDWSLIGGVVGYSMYPGQKIVCNLATMQNTGGDVFLYGSYAPKMPYVHIGYMRGSGWASGGTSCKVGGSATFDHFYGRIMYTGNRLIGWYDVATTPKRFYEGDYQTTIDCPDEERNMTLWPVFNNNDYNAEKLTLYFDANNDDAAFADGETVKTLTCDIGGTVTLPDAPSDGYHLFRGWMIGNGNFYPAGATIKCSPGNFVTYNNAAFIAAAWDVLVAKPQLDYSNKIQFYYYDKNNKPVHIGDQSCYGGFVSAPKMPQVDGYTFTKWTSYVEGGEPISNCETVVDFAPGDKIPCNGETEDGTVFNECPDSVIFIYAKE